MQAEIWRAASHSRFYTRYFRVFPGFLGLKSFLNFFKKRVLGPIFTLQSSSEEARRAVLPSPLHALHPKFFEDFFLHHLPAVRSSDSQRSPAANPPKQPPRERSQDPLPTPPKTKTPGDSKISEVTKTRDNEKAPRRTSGLQWSG